MKTTSNPVTFGFTLIELMITLALLAFLMLIGLPLARSWVQSAHQRDAAGMLIEGLGRAKALAMRDPQGVTDQSLPIAATCLVGGKLSVVAANANGMDCSNAVSWIAQPPSDASIMQPGNAGAAETPFQCVAFNERGIALAASAGSATCAPSPSLNVEVGNEDAFKVPLP